MPGPKLSAVTLGPKHVPQNHQLVRNAAEHCYLEKLGQLSHGQHSLRTDSGRVGSEPGAAVRHADTEAW